MPTIPEDVGSTWIEDQLVAIEAVGVNTDVHCDGQSCSHIIDWRTWRTHQALITDQRGPLQPEGDGHVVLVVGRIETSDVQQRTTQAVPKVLREQGRLTIVVQPHGLPTRRISGCNHAILHCRLSID